MFSDIPAAATEDQPDMSWRVQQGAVEISTPDVSWRVDLREDEEILQVGIEAAQCEQSIEQPGGRDDDSRQPSCC